MEETFNLSSILLIRQADRDAKALGLALYVENRGLWWEVEAITYEAGRIPIVMIHTKAGVKPVESTHPAKFTMKEREDNADSSFY